MICKTCGKDKPEDQFPKTSFKYTLKSGEEKEITPRRKDCHGCIYQRNKKNDFEKMLSLQVCS
jgi:hypothetical protein